MRKSLQFKAGRSCHLVSRIAHREFFLDGDERKHFVGLPMRVATRAVGVSLSDAPKWAVLIGAALFLGAGAADARADDATAELGKFRQLADRRIAAIRETASIPVPASAPCYYVSAKSGDDAADGRTPATAWRTAARLEAEKIAPGSFVLFERGGLYRGTVVTSAGVTYTAYGKGPKPVIYGSPENGADPAKWTQTENPCVWAYDIGHEDVGTLVFDEGRQHAIKHVVYTDKETGKKVSMYTGRPFGSYRDLDTDLHFWHDYSKDGTGKVYLYSRENPGTRFKSIEFNVRRRGFAVGRAPGVTIDNFTVKYLGWHGVGALECKDLTVSNCEFGWIGGSIQSENFRGRGTPVRFGNAVEIYGGCDNYTVTNCYVYQVYDAGLTQQYGVKENDRTRHDQRNVRYADNVIEKCNYSIEYFLSTKAAPDNPSRIENFVIEDNLMFDAGVGFCEQRPDREEAAHIKSWAAQSRNRATGYVVRRNAMCRSNVMFVQIYCSLKNEGGSSTMPVVTDNVFIGRAGQRFGLISETSRVCETYANGTQAYVDKFGSGNRCLILPARRTVDVRLEDMPGNPFGAPVRVEGVGDASCLKYEASTKRLYVGGDHALWVLDAADPLRPKLLGVCRGIGEPRQLCVQDGMVYVAARETGVWILDARDPARPRLVSRVDTVELATGIDVCHPVLFCGQRDFGVECIDVSDPARPAHIRMLKTSESQSVVYRDGVLYSGDWHTGELTVIDVRDMRTAEVVRVEKLQGHGDGVDADARFAYVSTGHHGHDPSRSREENFGRGHGLEIFDIAADPFRPRFVSRVQFPRFYSLGKDYWTPVACGRTVFCADTYNGLFAVDASDPANPRTIGRITARTSRPWKDYDGNEISLTPVKDLAPGEGVVYFAVPRGGLYLTATDRAFPRVPRRAVAPKNAGYRADYPHESAHFDVWRPDSRVQVRGAAAWRDVLYVACSDLGLVLLRRDSAGALVEAGRLGGRYVGDVKVVDGRLYAAEGTAGVAVYDLADPVKPREVARCRDFGEAVNFAAWVWAPLPGWIVVSNRESGCVYLRVGADGQMKRVLRCDGCPGWDRYVADRAIGGRWIAQSTANTGFAWIDVAGDPPRVIRSRANRGAIMAGNCAFRGDRLLRFPYEGGIQYLRPGQAENADGSRWAADAPLRSGRTNVFGQPAWDGANLLALTTRNIRAVTLVDVADESNPKVLWSETVRGNPEAPCWWQGRIVVPCGYQGLLVSTKRAEKPYDAAKPWAYWWWLNGNVSEASIARDLDELASAGFGGVVHVDPRGYWDDAEHTVLPKSAMPVGGGRWTDLVAFSIRECAKRRLGFVCLDSSDAGELKDAASRRVDVRDPAAVRRHLDTWLGPLVARVGDLAGTTWVGVTTASWEGDVAGWDPAEAGRIAADFYGTERAWLGARGLELWGQLGGPWDRRVPFFAAADQLKFYSFADVPEGEFWSKWFGDNHGGSYHVRGVVSAAHLYGRPIAQAEAFTHMTRHWSKDPAQLKRSAVEAFADGVNRLVFHEWTCRDESWGLPGNEYFAGTHFNGATTWSAHLKDFVAFVTRCQRLLQLGEPVVDIAICAGPHPYQGGIGQGRLRYDPFGDGRVTVPRGYAYDVVNDDFLAGRAKGCGYACVVRAEGSNRVDVAKAAELPLPDCEGDVTFAHRRTADSDIYFVAGEGPQTLTFRVKGRHAALYDPVSGDERPLRTRETSDGRTRVAVELPARDGCAFVIFRDPVEVKGPWRVTFCPATGRPPFARTFAALADWNESDDPDVRFFAGTATYRATVTVPSGARIAALAFGEPGSGLATVRVNGVAAQGGRAVWCAPWRADCRGLFRDGENTIEIDVTNNWMNRLIGDAALPPDERTTKSNLRLEPDGAGAFNDFSGYRAGDRLQPCGLRGPVELLAWGVETR